MQNTPLRHARVQAVAQARLQRLGIYGHPGLRFCTKVEGYKDYVFGARAGPSVSTVNLFHPVRGKPRGSARGREREHRRCPNRAFTYLRCAAEQTRYPQASQACWQHCRRRSGAQSRKERLLANPTARLSLEAQQRKEKSLRMAA